MKRATLVTAGLLVLGLIGIKWWRNPFRLPAHITLEQAVEDFSASFDRHAVIAENAETPVQLSGLSPLPNSRVNGGYRRAIIALPRSVIRFNARVPNAAFLHFGMGIKERSPRDPEASGVRFTVSIDGRPSFSRVVNPAANRRDRGWLDEQLDLLPAAGRTVEITLATEVVGDGARLPGTPAWSNVRLMQETERDRQPASATAPNVLLLLVDTLRADTLGCYGAKPTATPNLDRLAATGLLFANAVSQSSWTMPSVASVLTGLYPRSHGVSGEHRDPGGEDEPQSTFLPDVLPTVAEQAARAGITTVAVSGNALVSRGTNFAQGFETFVEFGLERRFGGRDKQRNYAPAAEINGTFMRWLGRNRDSRFLAYLHYMEPHDPYTPSANRRRPPPSALGPELAGGYIYHAAQRINRRGAPALPPEHVAYLRHLYDAEVSDWDAELGRLLEALDGLGVRDSTVIVVTADHGEEFQDHGRLTHGIHLYDEAIRVPLVITGPGISPAQIQEQAQGVDLFPTVAAVLGVAVPPDLPGQNLLAGRASRPAFSELASGTDGETLSVRTASWKLLYAPADRRYELYDLGRDPAERENRFGSEPEGERLAGLLERWLAVTPPAPVAEGSDPHLREKLRALGYVE